jgi:hypothetical protein
MLHAIVPYYTALGHTPALHPSLTGGVRERAVPGNCAFLEGGKRNLRPWVLYITQAKSVPHHPRGATLNQDLRINLPLFFCLH